MRYVLLWCTSNPDTYYGHRVEDIRADSLEEAKEKAYDFLDRHWVKAHWEFRLLGLDDGHDSGSRVWDTRPDADWTHDNDYQVVTYWSGEGNRWVWPDEQK